MEISAQDIFLAVNQIRENPGLALNEIKDQFKRFQSNGVYRNKRDIRIRTVTGKSNWQDAILALQRQKCKGNFSWNTILAKAVNEYAEVVKEDGSINPFEVIKNFCTYEGNIAFNVNESDAEQQIIEMLATMIVGDGDEKKGVRTAIFHPLFKQFACNVQKSGNKIILYTIFAQSVKQNTNSSPNKVQNNSHNQYESQSRSQMSWDLPSQSNSQNRQTQNRGIADKYKSKQQELSYEDYIKRGKQLIAELNKIRKQPKNYVHALKAQIQKFKDDKTLAAEYGNILTKEGNIPYFDLISELESQYPLPTIREVTGLSLVALQQVKQQQETLMEQKSPIQYLLDKFCCNIEGIRSIKLREIGQMPIQAMLMKLLVGDGDRKRTARRKMLSPICKAVGCCISKNMLVINVGETAKNNPGVVEQYLQNISQGGSCMSRMSPKRPQKRQQQRKNPSQNIFSFENKNPSHHSHQSGFHGERVVIKKTSKSHNQSKAGRIYRITEIQIIYNDGQIQKIVEEELLQ